MQRIYLVEDDQTLASLTQKILVKTGYDVVVFNDAKNVVESVEEQQPDLILMDIMLPHVNGGEAVKELGRDSNLKNIPVVFMTGLIFQGEEFEKLGITIEGKNYKILGKPFGIDQLLGVVKQSLN